MFVQSHISSYSGLKIATNTVANVTKPSTLSTSNYLLVANLTSSFLKKNNNNNK